MDKALAIMAIVCAALAAVMVVIVTGSIAYLLLALVALAAGVLAFARRGTEGIVTGAILTIAALVAMWMAIGTVNGENISSPDTTTADYYGAAAAITAALLVSAGVAFLTRDVVDSWMPIASGAALALGLIVLWVWPERIGEYMAWQNWVVAIAGLAAATSAFGRLFSAPATAHTHRTAS